LELVRYIHLNPLRRSVERDLEELKSYRWSGHAILVGKVRNDWQETGYVLGRFGGERKKAIRIYERFIGEGRDRGRRPGLVDGD
jgi:putative transposase